MTTTRTPSPEVALLLGLLDESFDRKAWHGPNLRAAIRGLGAPRAAWRPGPGRHNAWELVLHCAYWAYAVRCRLTGEGRAEFPRPGSNWFAAPAEASEAAWRADVRLLVEQHRALRAAASRLRPADLRKPAKGHRQTPLVLVRGLAAHHLYHAGQIQLLRRLRP
ncbi:MAG: DinB family protein [Acidobacteria bacterium]|nr:DinB family protein [Acidobacteriota bacterium]